MKRIIGVISIIALCSIGISCAASGPETFPSPSNTGWQFLGVTLTPYTGPFVITQASTIIDSADIPECLDIEAPNVRIQRSRITCYGDWGIKQYAGATGLVVQATEIASPNTTQLLDTAIITSDDGSTIDGVYVHGTMRGIEIGNNTVIQNSWIGGNVNPGNTHTTALASCGGTNHVIVQHNTLRTEPNTYASSSVSLYDQSFCGGANDDWLITDNLLDSGGEYCLYASGNSHIRFTNNKFGTANYANCGNTGPVGSWDDLTNTNTWSGNVWYDEGNNGSTKNGQTVTP